MNTEQPLVSISCITYNHVNYIRDTIEGFLMQKTNFDFEILIHDDASTDGTEEIIREYEKMYPKIIKPLYEKENQWIKGRKGSVVFNFPRAKGKYIALCEGDDYWTDCYKLQKQVDFMEKNQLCSLIFHSAKVISNNNSSISYIVPLNENKSRYLDYEEIILGEGSLIPTASMLFRKSAIEKLPEWFFESPVGDYPLNLILGLHGRVFFLSEVMCVYSVFIQNSWTSRRNYFERITTDLKILSLLNNLNRFSKYRYSEIINKKKIFIYLRIGRRFFTYPIKKIIKYFKIKNNEKI